MAALDDATDVRFILGIGASWSQIESELLGGDFQHRWGQTKDSIGAMWTLWQNEKSAYSGNNAEFSPAQCYSKTARK